MIFLSHNFKDKDIVEKIALEIAKVIPKDDIFYDSWSIQPGEGIISKMEEGLKKSKLFFLFMSKNSLNSNAVSLEWQNVLMRSLKDNELKLIPIKIDDCEDIPVILNQFLYLDLYNNGFDVTIRQILDIIYGRNIYQENFKKISNLTGEVTYGEEFTNIKISANYFLEPITRFFIVFKEQYDNMEIEIEETVYESRLYKEYIFSDGSTSCGYYIKLFRNLNPKNPINITFKNNVKISSILHIEGSDKGKSFFKDIPITIHSLTDPLLSDY